MVAAMGGLFWRSVQGRGRPGGGAMRGLALRSLGWARNFLPDGWDLLAVAGGALLSVCVYYLGGMVGLAWLGGVCGAGMMWAGWHGAQRREGTEATEGTKGGEADGQENAAAGRHVLYDLTGRRGR